MSWLIHTEVHMSPAQREAVDDLFHQCDLIFNVPGPDAVLRALGGGISFNLVRALVRDWESKIAEDDASASELLHKVLDEHEAERRRWREAGLVRDVPPSAKATGLAHGLCAGG